ncbi:MAG: signal peptidase [Thermoleophilaceae bacterium]|jgi:signal peptidase I|nr:signal peptidase [Thermoleophilaceae bacterium]
MRKLRRNSVFELAFTIVVALGLALCVQAYAVKPYRIPSPSMEPTLKVGQRVLVNRFSHRLGSTPQVGDVVVFHPPVGADSEQCGDHHSGAGTKRPCARPVGREDTQNFIKRVVAVGGDTIAIVNGHAVRNGVMAKESFAAPCGPDGDCNFRDAIKVPAGYVFMMGDNRGESDDSRYWGPVPVSWVVGQAFASYWPLSRIGGV